MTLGELVAVATDSVTVTVFSLRLSDSADTVKSCGL